MIRHDLGSGYFAEFSQTGSDVDAEVYKDETQVGRFKILDTEIKDDMEFIPSGVACDIIERIKVHRDSFGEPEFGKIYRPPSFGNVYSLYEKYQRGAVSPSDSDEELPIREPQKIDILRSKRELPVNAMTVACKDGNIKGSTLIAIVHDKVHQWKEKTEDSPLDIRDGVLRIHSSSDWFQSLGGWKTMVPLCETPEWQDKISSVVIYNNGVEFPISDECRIHLPEGFKVRWYDVTKEQTDLPYVQITWCIRKMRESLIRVGDPTIADMQLKLLRGLRLNDSKHWFKEHFEVEQFLDYLNALMFGMEASGINASLVTSLMALDLIVEQKFKYADVFSGKDNSGIYPYACRSTSGIFNKREIVLLHEEFEEDQMSMRGFREYPPFSPVAAKEATLIKYWLKVMNVLDRKLSRDEQVQAIEEAIDRLIEDNFFPQED